MKPMNTVRILWIRWLVIFAGLTGGSLVLSETRHDMALVVGEQQLVSVDKRLDSLAVGDPDRLSAVVFSKTSFLLTPLRPGTTQVIARYEDGTRATYAITIARAQVTGRMNSLEAQSLMRSPDDGNTVDRSIVDFDVQVQTDVRIVEVNRSRLKSAGVFIARATSGTTSVSSPPGTGGGVGDIVSDTLNRLSSLILPASQGYNLVVGSASRGWLAAISALERSGVAYTLARPSLVSMSGQEALFTVGGEFPIPIRQGTGDGVTIDYREYGIRLRLTTTVLDGNRIMLRVAPEVSELDFNTGVSSGGVSVPGLRVRRTETTVMLGDGESFVISGLVSESMMENADKFPGLGDIPILGALFRGGRMDKEHTELLMVVTPHLVRPLRADADLPRLPGESLRQSEPSFLRILGQDRYFGTVRNDRTGTGFSR